MVSFLLGAATRELPRPMGPSEPEKTCLTVRLEFFGTARLSSKDGRVFQTPRLVPTNEQI